MDSTSAPASDIAWMVSGVAVPASSTTSWNDFGPVWRMDRTPGSWWSVEASKRSCIVTSTTSPPSADLRTSAGVPNAMRRPCEMSATRSHSSASVTYWVVTIAVTPLSRRRWSSSQTVRRRIGSMPAVGSSRIEQVRLVDERGGELEAAPHAPGELARAAAPDVPQVEQLEHLAACAASGART